jgi:hypothetical protein
MPANSLPPKGIPAVHITASNIKLFNIGQLVEVVVDGVTTMGKLERAKFHHDAVTLRISGDTVNVPADKVLNVRRSPELHEMRLTSLSVEELADTAVGA